MRRKEQGDDKRGVSASTDFKRTHEDKGNGIYEQRVHYMNRHIDEVITHRVFAADRIVQDKRGHREGPIAAQRDVAYELRGSEEMADARKAVDVEIIQNQRIIVILK